MGVADGVMLLFSELVIVVLKLETEIWIGIQFRVLCNSKLIANCEYCICIEHFVGPERHVLLFRRALPNKKPAAAGGLGGLNAGSKVGGPLILDLDPEWIFLGGRFYEWTSSGSGR